MQTRRRNAELAERRIRFMHRRLDRLIQRAEAGGGSLLEELRILKMDLESVEIAVRSPATKRARANGVGSGGELLTPKMRDAVEELDAAAGRPIPLHSKTGHALVERGLARAVGQGLYRRA